VGKAPRIPRYRSFFAAPPTRAQLITWARAFPYANVALLVQPSGLFVVDADGAAAQAEAGGLGLPPTLTARTAHGTHSYYRRPPGCPVARATKRGTSRSIDLLAHGYVIAPPSRHRTSTVYTFADPTVPLADPPAWAVDWLRHAPPPMNEPAAPSEPVPADLPAVNLETLGVDLRVRAMIRTGCDPRHPSASETRYRVVQALIFAGYDDATIAAVLLNPGHGIHATLRRRRVRFVWGEIARARAKTDVEVFA
jgi:hypothetical protein